MYFMIMACQSLWTFGVHVNFPY